jgi:hypothetical protein
MRIRLRDHGELLELLGSLRSGRCTAYLVDERTIEARFPIAGARETAAITALVDDWRARRVSAMRLASAAAG